MSRYRQPYTLFKRGKYWYYRTYGPDGLRTTAKTTGCTSKTQAKEYCNGLYLQNSLWITDIKFYNYAVHFFDDDSPYVKDRIKPLTENTLKSYRTKMEQAILPFFQNAKLSDINYTRLKQFRMYLLEEKKYKPSVVVGTMSVLKHIFDSAFRDRIIAVNPFDYLESFSAPQSERDAFTLEEVIYIYQNISEEFKNTVLLMALTGLRISEAVGVLTNEIIKSHKGFEYIKLEKQYNLKKIKPVKMDSRRSIPIIPEIKDLMGFEPMRLSAFYREFNAIKVNCKNYEERELCFHSLRHFFITNAKAEGCADIKVEYLAGHKLQGQRKVYTNFKAEDVVEILSWQSMTIKKIRGID